MALCIDFVIFTYVMELHEMYKNFEINGDLCFQSDEHKEGLGNKGDKGKGVEAFCLRG